MRALETPRVSTASSMGESMPALVVSRGKLRTIYFDLTSAPPVQRSADTPDVEVTAGGSWKHSAVIAAYSDAELSSIAAYLRAVAVP